MNNIEQRLKLTALAHNRIEIHYHQPTNTHIVMQLKGTEIGNSLIKGYADFADDSFAKYNANVAIAIEELDSSALQECITRLTAVRAEIRNMRHAYV